MKNLAGNQNASEYISKELEKAGIEIVIHDENVRSEVPTNLTGKLGSWTFDRAWYYWVARGNVIPFEYADALHLIWGTEVRVAGHCMCPPPREWYKNPYHTGVPLYHVDTQEGLNVLTKIIHIVENLNQEDLNV